MYVELETAKKHLNLDDSFNDDDSYITLLIQAAEDAVRCAFEKMRKYIQSKMQ